MVNANFLKIRQGGHIDWGGQQIFCYVFFYLTQQI